MKFLIKKVQFLFQNINNKRLFLSITITCKCGLNTILNEDSIGKKIQCKNCNAKLEIPSEVKTSISADSNIKKIEISSKQSEIDCPFCIEKIPENSLTCPICEEDLTKNFSNIAICSSCSEKIPNSCKVCPFCGEEFNSAFGLSTEQTNAILSDHFTSLQNYNSLEHFKPKRFTVISIVFLCITILIMLVLISLFFIKPFEKEAVQVFSVLMFLFAGFTGIYYLIDKKARNMQSIASPTKFFKFFFKCLRDHRNYFAYQSVSPLGRVTKTTKLLPFNIINIDSNQYDITTANGFKRYWRSTLLGSGTYNRIVKIKKIKLLKEFENIAILEITLKLQSYNAAISVGKAKEIAIIQKILLKHDNKWFVAEGEFQGNLDFATFKEGV